VTGDESSQSPEFFFAPTCEIRDECIASLVMKERYFDDLKAGDRFKSSTYKVTEEGITSFAREFDPQGFHLDSAKAKQTMFEGLIASGWHTAAITMRLFVQTLNFAEGAIGLGVDELRWPNPVRPGDLLQVETEIIDLRESRSKPTHGIIRLRNVTSNQRGKIVQTMMASAMVPKRRVN
jgi:acyl dehydratase